jgi:hypothetical protein
MSLRCRVYWYSHGCDLARGHRDRHLCLAGHEPYSPFYRGWVWYRVFGEDTKWWERRFSELLSPLQATYIWISTKKLRHHYRKQGSLK